MQLPVFVGPLFNTYEISETYLCVLLFIKEGTLVIGEGLLFLDRPLKLESTIFYAYYIQISEGVTKYDILEFCLFNKSSTFALIDSKCNI